MCLLIAVIPLPKEILSTQKDDTLIRIYIHTNIGSD